MPVGATPLPSTLAAALALALAPAACRSSSSPPAEPIDVEVTMPRRALAVPSGPGGLDQTAVDAIANHRDVARVIPHLTYDGQAVAVAALGDRQIVVEVGPFTEGIPATAVAAEPALAARFTDLDPAAPPGPPCTAGDPAACPAGDYCDAGDQRCHPRVPVLIAPGTVSLYRDDLAGRHDQPAAVVDDLVAGRATLPFTLALGRSNLAAGGAGHPVHEIGAELVGVSAQARLLGMTAPIGHVAAWNREQLGDRDATVASSLVVTLRDRGRLDGFTRWARDRLGVEVAPVELPPDPGLTGASVDR